MDRDMVNCLQFLYHWGKLRPEQFEHDHPDCVFWCGPDTGKPFEDTNVLEQSEDGNYVLAPGVSNFIDMVENQLGSMPNQNFVFGYPITKSVRKEGDLRPAFLAIPYAPEFEPVKKVVLVAAAKTGFQCEVTGDLSTPGNIMNQVWRGIRGADVVLADISSNNPNVFYEIGLAHALGKEVVLFTRELAPPFDIQASRQMTYDPGKLKELEDQLVDSFKSVSARYPFEGDEPIF